ncbi:hypothetical protein PHYPSEUDO_001844 [Phytophthora pseudosyringae]|uniref:Uncharacterized protein n=1 Tax=Phytophthora pseudosyringae TaxID=221518 RepID=A0A8T1VV91_9STRA|nr:hypothetical protein PHYPSEUDO_001844 [Phytophthora pseudosyringae]
MTNLRVIVGFAAAAVAIATMTAAKNVKEQHLRDGRMLAEAVVEAAFLDSFANDMDSIDGILTSGSPLTEPPTTSPTTDDLTPLSTTEPTSDATVTPDATTTAPAATDESTPTSTTLSSDASASEPAD